MQCPAVSIRVIRCSLFVNEAELFQEFAFHAQRLWSSTNLTIILTEQRAKEIFPTGRPVLFLLCCKMKVIRLKIAPIFLPSRWFDDRVLERKQTPWSNFVSHPWTRRHRVRSQREDLHFCVSGLYSFMYFLGSFVQINFSFKISWTTRGTR
jgi:hypothetical protein